MISQRKAANALSGKTARPCDGCSRKRARWFCVADDAFLCQSCDDSVHSSNPLANRHERVRLETASFKASESSSSSSPMWHQGFTKKARTPRPNRSNQVKDGEKIAAVNSNPVPLVPEIEESIGDEDEDDLIYRVPVYDPFSAELCHSQIIGREEGSCVVFEGFGEPGKCDDLGNLQGFLPSDVDLAEFAADVENFLGKELDDGDFKLLDCKQEDNDDDEKFVVGVDKKVKDELEMEEIIDSHWNQDFGIGNDSMEWSFGYETPGLGRVDEDQEEQKVVAVTDDGDAMAISSEEKKETKKRPSLLRLNYEAIITAWASQGSPWTTGNRPQLNLDDCLPDSMDGWGKDGNFAYGGGRRESNGAREARVLRYKEKRRTRLFSKKIRYEVRKLNAEKRPRMKGRFVKRTSFMPTAAFSYVNK